VPDDVAVEALGEPGTIRISRGGNITGDLDVFYSLGGTADSNDYMETYTGTATIPAGSISVDLVFTPANDGVFEGFESIQLDLTPDASYALGATTTGTVVISDITYGSTTNLALTIEPDGGVSLTRDGVLVSTPDSGGWSIFRWTDGSTRVDTRTALDIVTPLASNELLLASSDEQFEVRVEVTALDRYLKFELVEVINDASEPFGLNNDWPGHRVEFDLDIEAQGDGWQLNTLPLNPMTEIGTRSASASADGIYFAWPYPQWAQTDDRPQPQGMVAVFGCADDTEHDDILADIWVAEESLPRPNRDNLTSWTKADVNAWLDAWIVEEARPLRELSFSPGGNPANLYAAADICYAGGLNRIGLHNFDWQGNSQGDASASLFPNGVSDVIAWRQYCETRGIDYQLHGFGQMVQFDDPYYGRFSSHEGLARSAAGTLVNSVAASETTLIVEPDLDYYPGMKAGWLPHYSQPPWGGVNGQLGNTFPPFYESNTSAVRINGKLYRYSASITTNNQWQVELGSPLSGFRMAAHTAGDAVEFMVMGKTGWFTPDSRSVLLDQLADDYASILNHFKGNALYDGAGWTGDLGSWGYRKFTQMVYEGLDHPANTGSSTGAGPFGHFEGRFKRIQNAFGSDTTVSLRKSKSAALALGMDDVFHNLSTVPDATSMRIRGDHAGITVDVPQAVGIWDEATAAMDLWSNMNPFLTPQQVATIATMNDIHVASQTSGQWELIRTRAMRRPGIDGIWRRMTERPDVAPRQYFKADGATLSGLENPYATQVPDVQLHVMAAMSESSGNNITLMPTSAGMIVNPTGAEQTLTYDSGKIIVSLDNSQSPSDYYHWDRNNPPTVGYWTYQSLSATTTLDMNESRGIAITVNVPAGQDVDGGLLAFATSGGFPRTYLVELDFVGQRTFEIPHGDAANNSAVWASYNSNPTGLISAHNYESDLFRVYITGLPAGESTSVEVVDIKAMKEDRTTGLVDPVLTLNSSSVTVSGTIPYNNYLVYSGGAVAGVYDENWNFVDNLPVTGGGLTAANGTNTFSVNATLSPNTHLSSRVKVQDIAGIITIDKPAGFDSDADGIADADEAGYGTSYTVWDSDGDGFSDGYEVQNGFSPTSAADNPELQVTSSVKNGIKTFTVTFSAAFAETYKLYSTGDLTSAPEAWDLDEAGILGAGGPVSRSFQTSEGSQRFFRIVRE
jgi:hypothetical protein